MPFWTASNTGAIVGCLCSREGKYRELGKPRVVDYSGATDAIVGWQRQEGVIRTLVLLDQPTIVKNTTGQRAVEHLVSSVVGRRYGGMQPANTGKADMFGAEAPLWPFLKKFGGPADVSPSEPKATASPFHSGPFSSVLTLTGHISSTCSSPSCGAGWSTWSSSTE
jgi:predicted RNase H-like nuclease